MNTIALKLGLGLCLVIGLASGCGSAKENEGDAVGKVENTMPQATGGEAHESAHMEAGEAHMETGDTHEASHADGHDTHEGKMEVPDSAEAIMAEVDEHLELLDNVVADGKLDQVHEIAFMVRDMLVGLPGKLDALPTDVSASLETALGKIRQQAELLDKYGDAGNAAQTKTVLTKFKSEIEGIKKLLEGHLAKNGAVASDALKMANNAICPISGSKPDRWRRTPTLTLEAIALGSAARGAAGTL